MNCKQCSTDFVPSDYRQKFCSRGCSASFNNSARPRRERSNGGVRVDGRACRSCLAILTIEQKTFCSQRCGAEWKHTQVCEKIKRGERVGVTALRQYLFRTRPHQCEICDGTEWFGQPMPLVMDHIDGDPSNDDLNNLRLICPNCDRFLPTFGSRNRGRGRKSKGIRRGSQL
jgi:hypothetical protein